MESGDRKAGDSSSPFRRPHGAPRARRCRGVPREMPFGRHVGGIFDNPSYVLPGMGYAAEKIVDAQLLAFRPPIKAEEETDMESRTSAKRRSIPKASNLRVDRAKKCETYSKKPPDMCIQRSAPLVVAVGSRVGTEKRYLQLLCGERDRAAGAEAGRNKWRLLLLRRSNRGILTGRGPTEAGYGGGANSGRLREAGARRHGRPSAHVGIGTPGSRRRNGAA